MGIKSTDNFYWSDDSSKNNICTDIALNIQDGGGFTALMVRAYDHDMHTVKLLLGKGAQLNLQNQFGLTALMCAVEVQAQYKMQKLLVKSGTDLSLKNDENKTAYMIAKSTYSYRQHNPPKILELLQESSQGQ